MTEATPERDPRPPDDQLKTSDLERELHEMQRLLLEERQQREQLEREVAAQRRDLVQVETEQDGLREAAEILGPPEGHSWRDDKRNLGAGLTVTGLLSFVVGVILHFAGQSFFIESNAHLGFFFGVIGLVIFLLGFTLIW